MATAPSPNELTRQQLDELDALLQRMLSLPLSSPDDPSRVQMPAFQTPPLPDPTPVRSWRVDPPATAAAAAPHMAAAPIAAAMAHSTLPMTEPIAYPEPQNPFLFRNPAPASTPEPARQPAPITRSIPTNPSALAAAPKLTNPSVPAVNQTPPETVSFVLWPLVGLNWTVDRLLGLFGPPGWLLRSGFGKNVLGLTGIGLLLYTAAHIAEKQGFVSFPVDLPWPQ
jgi:hypothetical protein